MQPGLLRAGFRDFDAFAETVRGWDFDFIQLGNGQFRAEFCQVFGRDLQLGYARFRTRLEQRGSAPDGLRTFAVLLDPGMRLHWRSHDIDGSSLMAFPQGGELYSVSGADFEVATLSIRDESLARQAADLEVDGVLRTLDRTDLFTPAPALMTKFRASILDYLDVVAATGSPPLDHDAREEEITMLLVRVIASAAGPEPRSHTPPRLAGLRRALDLIEAEDRPHLLVSDLVRAAGVSQSSLETAFRDRFHIGPKRYMMSRRMQGVRRELLRSAPGARIAEIARLWGFNHPSQFAADYRRWFGELPSETLGQRGRAPQTKRATP